MPSNPAKERLEYWRGGIGRRLLVAIVLFSSVITVILTVFDLYLDYRSGADTLRRRLDEIERSYGVSLGDGLWTLDRRQLEWLLEGIASLPDIKAVTLREINPSGPVPMVVAIGEPSADAAVARDIVVSCRCDGANRPMGILHVEAALTDLYRELLRRAAVILAGQAVKTFAVAAFILFIIHRLVTRHVLDIAAAVARFDPGAPLRLELDRRPGERDELDCVVDAFNALDVGLRRRDAELRIVASRMEAILGNIPDLVWIKDADGRYLAVNEPLARLMGFAAPADIVGKTDFDVSPLALAQEYRAGDAEVMASRQRRRFEERHVRSDGILFWIETIKTPLLDAAGQVAGTVGIARDITEKRAAQTALEESERRYRELVEAMPVGVFTVDTEGRAVLYNEAAVAIWGRRPVLGEVPWWDDHACRPDGSPVLAGERPSAQVRRDGHPLRDVEVSVSRPNGSRVDVLIWATPICDRFGALTGVVTTLLDITERKLMEQTLGVREQEYRTLVENIPDLIVRYSRDLCRTYVNPAWEAASGLSSADVVGVDIRRLPHVTVNAAYVAKIRQVLETGTVLAIEFDWENAYGMRLYLEYVIVPEFDRHRRVVGALAVGHDITGRKRAEEALARINRVLKTLSQGNEALVRAAAEDELFAAMCRVIVETGGYRMAWVGLAETDEAKTVRPVAHAGDGGDYLASATFSWAEDDVRGRGPAGSSIRTGLLQVVNDVESAPMMTPWRDRAMELGFRSGIALPLKTDDGVFGCMVIYAAEPDTFGNDETALFADLANDISYGVSAMRERRRRQDMERHLGQAQKMEALGQLAGSVAHDFNNLLGAMLGFARFIVEDAGDGDPARHYAQRILAAGQRGKALVGQILSFARRGEVKRERVALVPLLGEIRALLGASIPATTCIAIDAVDPDAAIDGDADQLSQVLFNLCLNAHDALAGTPGTVTMVVRPTVAGGFARLLGRGGTETAQAIDVWQGERGSAHAVSGVFDPTVEHVSLVVSDTGCGMDVRLLEQVFLPFFTTKGTGSGTGLGMAVVHGIVLAHGGALAVESRVGEGTRVEVVLPRAVGDAVAAAPEPPVATAPTATARRVLLVDDDPDFGDMLLTALERRGFEISPTCDPLAALEGVREHAGAWDAMVTDQTMPAMNGLDFIEAVKAIQPDLPCILCTGYAEAHLDGAGPGRAGVFAVLRKPVDVDELVETLGRAIGANEVH